jgi:adenylylsulfate kinase-like enzyme
MGKIRNIFRNTTEKKTKRREVHNTRKKARQEQILSNIQIRSFYRERTNEEIRLRQKKHVDNTEKK